tara:strand:+ start:2893 stop:3147 length:255 start_codon:yes stop_codon:yes gene_type:complete
MPRKTLADYKRESPEIPNITCPYIDFTKEVLSEIKDETDSSFVEEKIELVNNLLEYLRSSNESLRMSSKYWHDKFVYIYNKKNK